MRLRGLSGGLRRLLQWLRRLIDPLWIPPEEMEAERQEMLERVEMDKQRREEE